MFNQFINLGLIFQKHLPVQMLATYGTSPQVLAPLFNLLCIALLCLAIMYLLYLIFTNTNFATSNTGVFWSPIYSLPFSGNSQCRSNVHRW